jgi:hypothetical protein
MESCISGNLVTGNVYCDMIDYIISQALVQHQYSQVFTYDVVNSILPAFGRDLR